MPGYKGVGRTWNAGDTPPDTGDFDSVAANEAAVAAFVRAALTAQDITEAAGVRNVPLEGRTATADAGFLETRRGLLVNARLGALYTNNVQTALRSTIPGATFDETTIAGLITRAQIGALDTSAGAGSRAVPVGARGGTTAPSAVSGLVANARLFAFRGDGTDDQPLYSDLGSDVNNGRAPASIYGLWSLAVGCKRDPDSTLFTPTEMNRTVRTSTVNPADAAVLATLDCRGLTNKSLIIDSTVADDAHIEVSPDGTNWHRIASAVAYGVGVTIMLTAVQFEAVRGFRYVRMIQNGAAAGTVIGIISAQGA